VRSLVESEANNLQNKGHISKEQFTSIQNINGHSETTSQQYYIKQCTADNVVNGKKVFSKFGTSSLNQETCYNNNIMCANQISDDKSDSNEVILNCIHNDETNQYLLPDCQQVSSPLLQIGRGSGCSSSNLESNPQLHESSSKVTQISRLQSLSFSPSPSIGVSNCNVSPLFTNSSSATIKRILWGSEHPQINEDKAKYEWTSEEVEYIGNLANKLLQTG
jgi:hypothetical protein